MGYRGWFTRTKMWKGAAIGAMTGVIITDVIVIAVAVMASIRAVSPAMLWKHRAKGNGFGFGLVDGDSITRTLSARYFKDGSEILDRNPS